MISDIKTKTIGGVLSQKIATYLQENNLSKILRKAVELIAGIFLGISAVIPQEMMHAFSWAIKTHDFAVPKVAVISVLFFGRKSIIRQLKRWGHVLQVRRQTENKETTLDNIPVPELTDYLVRNKHFRREGVNGVRATFGLNMEKFNRLAKKLEENGVLTRGENNGRILDEKWSRQSLIDYLSGTKKSVDMQPRFVIHRIGAGAKIRLDRGELNPA